MPVINVFNAKREKVDELTLDDAIFGVEVKEHLFYTVVRWQLAGRRAGTHATKTRSQVSGGGKKPWKQKGTGRARQGSIRASHWVGGGKAMAPKARDYTYRPPKKVRRGALRAALSLKAREKTLIILDKFELDAAKSKTAHDVLTKRLKLDNALVVDAKGNEKLHRSIRNLAKFDVLPPEGLNLESVLRHKSLVLTSDAAKALEGSLT
jgi:large subunit ribosomal protein L4